MANKKIIPYNPKFKALARKLRKTMTDGEVLLWKELKGDKLLGFDFDRQRFIDNYIVDFYCRDLMLAIEIDGMSHNNEEAFNKDEIRQQKLESFGIQFLRFSEREIKADMPNVLRTIETKLIELVKFIHLLNYLLSLTRVYFYSSETIRRNPSLHPPVGRESHMALALSSPLPQKKAIS